MVSLTVHKGTARLDVLIHQVIEKQSRSSMLAGIVLAGWVCGVSLPVLGNIATAGTLTLNITLLIGGKTDED